MPLDGPPLSAITPLSEILTAGLASRPDDDAAVSLTERLSYRALDAAAARLAGAYAALGIRPGARIASLMPNCDTLIVHYLACFRAGFVAVPLNYRYTAPQIDHALAKSGASLIVHHADRTGDIARLAARPPLGTVTYGAASDAAASALETLVATGDPARAPDAPGEDAPALIMFTSGSTGPAKGVTHTRATFAAIVASCAAAFELTAADIVLPGSSMSHLGGLLFSFATLSMGARTLVARSTQAAEILPLLRQHRPTVLCMLPTALIHLLADGHADGSDFASLRLMRSGSDKVPLELEHDFLALTGLPIDEGYGMTELGLATLNPPRGPIKEGSIGCPQAGMAVSLRGDDGAEVPAGEIGLAFIRSPGAMAGYWEDPAATEAVRDGDWLESGDLMTADADGYLYFRGRRKQIIVHDGSNIFPQEVEEALVAHPGVVDAGVIGIHDLVHGETVRAYVVRAPGSAVTAPELIAFARERIGYRAPEEVLFLEEMPLNSTGKVDRPHLKALAEAHH
ncbi:class I adenylate-forming enzyme family protein [Gymnodinialimonas sp.]